MLLYKTLGYGTLHCIGQNALVPVFNIALPAQSHLKGALRAVQSQRATTCRHRNSHRSASVSTLQACRRVGAVPPPVVLSILFPFKRIRGHFALPVVSDTPTALTSRSYPPSAHTSTLHFQRAARTSDTQRPVDIENTQTLASLPPHHQTPVSACLHPRRSV